MINKSQLYDNLNHGILEERYKAFSFNLNKNLPLVKRFGGLKKIIPFFQKRNVVVAGAGPSLESSYHLLREKSNRKSIILISTDMALRPLVKNGIIPDYVFSCETTPVDFFGDIDTMGMHLIAFSCACSINLRKWRGGISFYNWMIFDPEYTVLWESAGKDLGFLATGSVITTQAVSFALGCGINSLTLIGNDMAFNHRFYAKESINHKKSVESCDRFSPAPAMELNKSRKSREFEIRRGADIFYTNGQFLAAKTWLEDLFSKQNIPIFDASYPGCSGRVVVKIGLEEFFIQLKHKVKKKNKRR